MRQVDWSRVSEQTLIEAAKTGNPAAFDVLVQRYRHAAVSLARQIVGSRELAEDVAQDALLTAYKALPQLGDTERFAGWLGAIVRHRARRLSQHPERHALRLDEILMAYLPALSRPETIRDEVECAIAALPPDQRSVAELYYLDQWETKQIAEFLELPVTTVKWRLHAARRLLRPRLAESMEIEE